MLAAPWVGSGLAGVLCSPPVRGAESSRRLHKQAQWGVPSLGWEIAGSCLPLLPSGSAVGPCVGRTSALPFPRNKKMCPTSGLALAGVGAGRRCVKL